jgi:quinol monooxygenase YgiN
MYARLVKLKVVGEKMDELSHIVQTVIVPVLKEEKGFIGQLFLVKAKENQAVSINWWQGETEMAEFESGSVYRELMGKIKHLLAGPPEGEHYLVSVDARMEERTF